MRQHNSKQRRRREKTLLFFISMICLFLVGFPARTFAESNKVSFDAQAVLPENQQSDASYYDLKVQPGETQNLVLKLHNNRSEPTTVIIEANNARTNLNGVIDYSKHGQKIIGGPSFEEMISDPQTVTLKPEEDREVVFQLKIPDKGFDGTVLGGFYCYEDTRGKEEKSEGFSLKNKFAYTIGAKLNCSDKEIQPKFALTNVTPGLENGYLTIFADLENPQPLLMSKLAMYAVVTKKGEKKALREFDKKISFAPRTKFKLPINWDNEPLKKGKYELNMVLKNDKGQTWTLKKDFEIRGEDEKLNKKAVEVKETDENHLFVYSLLILCLVIIIGLIWYIYRLKNKKPQNRG
jgi:cbb3-type cytochrome oxidase subunit 3